MFVETKKSAGTPCGYQQLTVGNSAVGLTVPLGASRAIIGVETQPIRYRNDGIDPTASVGFHVANGTTFEIDSREGILALKLIRASSDSIVNITYYK